MIPVLPKIPQPAFMTIPIVGGVGPDQLAVGLVTSFSPPVGNVTGFSAFGVELSAKRLQLLKEASPAILHLATLWNPAGSTSVRRARTGGWALLQHKLGGTKAL